MFRIAFGAKAREHRGWNRIDQTPRDEVDGVLGMPMGQAISLPNVDAAQVIFPH
jgi:hypothetical protein